MAQVEKNELERMDYVAVEHKNLDKSIVKAKTQARAKEFLTRLSQERKLVKENLQRLYKKAELNARYLEHTYPIQKIKYQQDYRNNLIYKDFK